MKVLGKSVKVQINLEYATIEFAGYPAYYFLKDGKLYRSEREMRNDVLGRRINYPK